MDPSPLLSTLSMERVGPAGGEQVIPTKPSRHRRIHKEVGAVTGITFTDHPKPDHGVVVSALTTEGACAKSGVCVGDHITKINGERVMSRDHAVTLCDAAWTAEADGTDKNKDRLKFSLHLRSQEFFMSQKTTTVAVEVLGARKSLLGGKAKLEDTGLVLEDAPGGLGALVASVTPDSLASMHGFEAGLTIVAVGGELCNGSAKDVSKMIDAQRSKKGTASLLCHLKKTKDDDLNHI